MTTLKKKIIVTIAGISVTFIISSCQTTDKESEQSRYSSNSGVNSSSSTAIEEASYADGVYEATGQYGSLPSSITVTVTLVDEVITDVKVTPHATNPTSLDLQRSFAAAVPQVVVGKRIDEVKVGRLAGSSGTPDGFNDAIEQIKEQANS
ncbi:hypothetical protein [Bacillus sp. USDA818B3_A]|uniref:hypothetical protein n=1 Tax=Bacillus sp. USDA818B3_A TaxID=2698834 RepID=UPI001921B6C8|nr:hypothetical protein [Bacillus sp. USDA818B3_A]